MRHMEGDRITLKNDKDKDVQIQSKNIFTPRKNLGHYKVLGGNQITQFDKIRNQTVKLTNDIVRCNCTQSEAKMLYESAWRKSVEYTLSQLFLNSKQLENISKKALPKNYFKCEYNKNTKKEILKGPAALGGGSFTPLKGTAGSGYITHLLKN